MYKIIAEQSEPIVASMLKNEKLYTRHVEINAKKICRQFAKLSELPENERDVKMLKMLAPLFLKPSEKAKIHGKIYKDYIARRLELFTTQDQSLELTHDPAWFQINCKPDWVIVNKFSGNYVNGYNFIDIHSGGYQFNLAREIITRNNPYNLLVVGIPPKFSRKGTIKYRLVEKGLEREQLVFSGKLESELYKRLSFKNN